MYDLIVDFPTEIHPRKAVSTKPKKKMVRFSTNCDIRFYERNNEAHAKELHYSGDDIRRFKATNKQAILNIHKKHLSLANGSEKDARAVFQGCETTGYENLLTPNLASKTMASRRGCWNAVLDEQDRQDASGCYDSDRLARASQRYSGWTTRMSVQIGMIHQVAANI